MSKKHRNGNNNGNGQPHEQKTHKEFKPKTQNQQDYVRLMVECDIVFCTGPAGSGKTHCAAGLACEHLLHKKINQIVITRPVVEAGKQGLGALPGTLLEKMTPYITPIIEEMEIYLGRHNVKNYQFNETINVIPLEYMRGRNCHQSFMILDEAQNATLDQIKMFITRIGRGSTAVIAGDIRQSDLSDNKMGLLTCMERLKDTRGVGIVELSYEDIIRNSIISRILAKLE